MKWVRRIIVSTLLVALLVQIFSAVGTGKRRDTDPRPELFDLIPAKIAAIRTMRLDALVGPGFSRNDLC